MSYTKMALRSILYQGLLLLALSLWLLFQNALMLKVVLLLIVALLTIELAELSVLKIFLLLPHLYKQFSNYYAYLFQLLLPVKFISLFFEKVKKHDILSAWYNFNNELVESIFAKDKPHNILLLVPRCLQFSQCSYEVIDDIEECRRCGKCQIADLLLIKKKYDIPTKVCLRTHYALKYIEEGNPDLVIGIACDSRLLKSIRKTQNIFRYLVELENSDDSSCINNKVAVDKINYIVNRLLG